MHQHLRIVFTILSGLVFLFHIPPTKCEKILFLTPFSTISENHIFEIISNRLALDGHEITVVTSSKSSNLPKNVTEIVPFEAKELFDEFSTSTEQSVISRIFYNMNHLAQMCDKLYDCSEFIPVLNTKYDLIFINSVFGGQCQYGIIHKNQSPFIIINTFPIPNYFSKDLGTYVPTSTVPYPIIGTTDQMNFRERLFNFLIDWAAYAYSELNYIPLFENVYRKHLGQDYPSVTEIQRNASLVMMNTHFTSTYHRPIMPDFIEIGGIHCKDPKPLPKELNDFVSGSVDGFIYFSFGSGDSGSLPKEMITKFLNVFSKLKQRVLWKFESESLEDLPENIKLSKWFPQQDLLGHPKIRLFISHGGLLSIQQAIYHRVPSLVVPMFFDQMNNAGCAVRQGYALRMNFWNFTEEELQRSISRLLNEPQFQENAKIISSVYRDQMNSPLERAIFWTNFVLKHKGAPQLRSSGRNLNFIQFHSIDVILFLSILISALLLLAFSALMIVMTKICKSNSLLKAKTD